MSGLYPVVLCMLLFILCGWIAVLPCNLQPTSASITQQHRSLLHMIFFLQAVYIYICTVIVSILTFSPGNI
ncbi:hypothetical protein GDO81_010959 [Engystomops pustulosus]|uniref:Secreted peptide n=1 Tax=Engystomops pustulosus TaxID=76066 RepID=A0AAV7C4K4_ENGPU|nr:hypothetical protein GDO81_010959 [Engystomops pustulosus]